jgi:carboxymethylenebutenolidase
MGGRYAVNFAARHPKRVTAAASIHGTSLVTREVDSPHLVMQKAKAEFYFGCAEFDPWMPLKVAHILDDTAKRSGINAEVEILKGLDHGFAFPTLKVYDKVGAERHWERLLSLFRRRLLMRPRA